MQSLQKYGAVALSLVLITAGILMLVERNKFYIESESVLAVIVMHAAVLDLGIITFYSPIYQYTYGVTKQQSFTTRAQYPLPWKYGTLNTERQVLFHRKSVGIVPLHDFFVTLIAPLLFVGIGGYLLMRACVRARKKPMDTLPR